MNSNSPLSTPSRRNFLKLTGSLVIGFPLIGGCWPGEAEAAVAVDLPGSLRRTPQINAWLEVLEEGRVRIFSGKVELGQGIRIAIKQVAAEELDMELDRVEVVLAETGVTPNEGYTAGSGSIQNSAMAVRYAAASARQKIVELAAVQLDVPVDQLELDNGFVRTASGDKTLSFFDLLSGKQIDEEVNASVPLKPKGKYRYVGKPIKRDDIGPMVRGEALFIQDLRFPNMRYARVLRPPTYQSVLLEFDESGFKAAAAESVQLYRNGNFLAVLADSEYQAQKALRLLKAHTRWSRPAIFPKQEELLLYMKAKADPPKRAAEKGDINAVESQNRIQARYFKPYTMHNSIGPATGIAMYDEETLHVWSHSQGIYPMREAISAMLGKATDQIHVISVPGAGCFGHSTADDAAADAALLAMAHPGQHIRVQWSREDENTWEPYGSAMQMELEAGLDESGKINYWKSDVWTDTHSLRPNKEAATLLAARYLETPFRVESRGYLGGGYRNADPYYAIPNFQVDAHFFDGPLRVSSLRSLGAYGNIFAMESMMDELAVQAGTDPITFRLKHLEDDRAIAVVKKVEEMSRKQEPGKREGIGYAFCRYKNRAAYCALAAKVSVEESTGTVKLIKMWAAVDVGEVINADGIVNQVEGALVQAASWTLKEAVSFDEYQIISTDWRSYPIATMSDTPEIEVFVIGRPNEPAMGGGEAATPPVAAAITNAIFWACGKRVYELPVQLG